MISEVELKEISAKLGQEISDKVKNEFAEAEKNINSKVADVTKGIMTAANFEEYKAEQTGKVTDLLAEVAKMEAAQTVQGNKINSLLEKGAPNSISFEDFLAKKYEEIKALKDGKGTGGYMEFSGTELKAAGVQSIATTIPTASAYAPGLAGSTLEIFNLAQNENFITSKINLGRTNSSLLAWANEKTAVNAAGLVGEGQLKPQGQHTYEIELSKAKKVAEWFELTDELVQDLPAFANNIQTLLNNDVVRGFDDMVQVDVQTAARAFMINGLNGKISFANYYDALNAMIAQVGTFNYTPNVVAYNWITNAIIGGQKNANGTYLMPPFAQMLQDMTVYANKMANYYALAGDLQQYHVDIYKDFYIKIGTINDELVNNKFAVVGEMRFHSYISDARKNGIVYDSLDTVMGKINKPATTA